MICGDPVGEVPRCLFHLHCLSGFPTSQKSQKGTAILRGIPNALLQVPHHHFGLGCFWGVVLLLFDPFLCFPVYIFLFLFLLDGHLTSFSRVYSLEDHPDYGAAASHLLTGDLGSVTLSACCM